MDDIAIIGGGIVGLAVAWALGEEDPHLRLTVLEKESTWASHQSGRNSGVIHSGIYYRPGSLKAKLAREGNRSMTAFCREHGLPVETCGKLIVATEPRELPLLERLADRAAANQLAVARLSPEAAREIEPHLRCLCALKVESTGITDYRQVCRKLAGIVGTRGGVLRLNTAVAAIRRFSPGYVLETNQGPVECRYVVNCAGLHSDRVARQAGAHVPARIIPFRGEYYALRPERRGLIRHLIYPVPDPNLPFLGIHFTRLIDGSIHAGPNAVLSLKREGYRKMSFDWRDAVETLGYSGFWRMAGRYASSGFEELWRSFSKNAFVKSLQRLVPDVQPDDLVPAEAGVRAQMVQPDGQPMDDFYLVLAPDALHVCNAPSPAATASLAIGRHVARQVMTHHGKF